MSAAPILRVAARGPPTNFFRCAMMNRRPRPLNAQAHAGFLVPGLFAASGFSANSTTGSLPFSTTALRGSAHEETFEEFTARFEKEFDSVQDSFELQRNLNNAFAYDLVPSVSVVVAALKAARRVNDFPVAVRVFEGIKAKVENEGQYQQYLQELKPLREELGIPLKEELYPMEQEWFSNQKS